jgi:ribosomal protein S27E
MLRHLIHVCVLLMLILQGMTPAMAHVSDQTTSQHCAGHEQTDMDCPCCSDHLLGANGGCAALCSIAVPISTVLLSVPRLNFSHDRSTTADRLTNPSYLPLIPPPIS